MEQIIKHLIIIASIMTVELTVTESKENDLNKKKHKIERPYHHPVFTNICDISDRRSKVHCYCDSSQAKMATWADCWVFSGEIREDDPIWPSFSSQSAIEHLIFNVRSDDALTFIPAKALIRLDSLKHLTIQFGTIKLIPAFAFTNSSSIRQISLKSNRISELEVNAFAKLMMLTNISLDDNQIAELKRDVFVEVPNLRVLHLSNNNLSLIHEGCFKYLNNLIELKLDSNYISVVTREMFEGLENLARLDLRNNKLSMIGSLAFHELWDLKELLLDNNAIQYVSERSFSGLAQLKRLSLSGNKLTAFYEDIIEDNNIRNLAVLDLSDNLLETISYDTIRTIVENDKSSSTALYLDGNPFICDCRLAWVYGLRNGTEDRTLREALEKISCIIDPKHETQDEQTNTGGENTNKIANVPYDYYEEKSDLDILYEEPRVVSLHNAVRLIDLTPKSLPCPKELLQTMEEAHRHPIQNEIRLKAFSASDKIVQHHLVRVFMVTALSCLI